MATQLTKFKRKRTLKRNNITKTLFINIDKILHEVYSESLRVDAACMFKSLTEVQSSVRELDEEILDLIEDDEELEADSNEAFLFDLEVKNREEKLRLFLQKTAEDTLTATSSVNRATGVKLPKLTLQSFDGDAINWKSFIESFDAAVDSKEHLSNIEKFTYLKGYLKNSALQCIEGFPLTNENYTEAMRVLKERYGNPQLIVSSHMNNLLKLEKVNSSNVYQLRALYDRI